MSKADRPLAGTMASTRAVVAAVALICGLWVHDASAARNFPINSQQVRITEVSGDFIVADGTRLHLSPGVLIFTTTNTTLVSSALPIGAIARVQLDMNGDVRRVWILNDDEILTRPWWQFFLRSQPQTPKP